MKKIMTLILSLILVVSLTACSLRVEVRDKKNNNNSVIKDVMEISNSISVENENEIDIEIKYGEIKIVGYDGNEVFLSVKSNLANDNITLNKDDDAIEIKDKGDESINLFGNNNVKREVLIKIPYSFNGNIDFEYGAGETEISDIMCDNMEIEGGAGSLKINDILFNKLYFSAGVGESDIKLLRKCGEINIKGGVGEVKVSLEEVGGDLTYDGGIGSAQIQIPENSPVYFNTSSGIGETNINAVTSSEKTYEFNVTVGIGEIKIYN